MLKIGLSKIYAFEPFFWIYYTWYYLPLARAFFFSNTYNLIFFSIFACGCVFCFIKSLMRRRKLYFLYSPLLPVLTYFIVFLVLVFFDVATASDHIRISFTFWGTLIVYYLTNEFPKAQKRLTIVMLVLFLVTTVTSLFGVISNPYAARILTYAANDIEEDLVIRMLNIGGITFFQGLVICVPILVTFVYQNKYRIFSILFLAMIFISLLFASFTIALAMFFVAALFGYLANNSFTKKAVIAVALVALVLFMPWADLFSYFASVINNETISARLYSISTSISYGMASGNLASRADVYMSSLNTFLKHPFGVGPEYTYSTFENGIGYHSQFLDDLARYGIFGLIFYIAFFIGYYKLIRKQWDKVNMRQIAIPVVVTYFCFLVFNIGFASAHEGVLMLMLMPALPEFFIKETRQTQSANIMLE